MSQAVLKFAGKREGAVATGGPRPQPRMVRARVLARSGHEMPIGQGAAASNAGRLWVEWTHVGRAVNDDATAAALPSATWRGAEFHSVELDGMGVLTLKGSARCLRLTAYASGHGSAPSDKASHCSSQLTSGQTEI